MHTCSRDREQVCVRLTTASVNPAHYSSGHTASSHNSPCAVCSLARTSIYEPISPADYVPTDEIVSSFVAKPSPLHNAAIPIKSSRDPPIS